MYILDLLFPKSCQICKKEGQYLCNQCIKLFKKNLPECYKCRKLSNLYITHRLCKDDTNLNSVFVGWEYNDLTSLILKKYKYSGVKDMAQTLSEIFVQRIAETKYPKYLEGTLLTVVPISRRRQKERGFNQLSTIGKAVSEKFGYAFSDSILIRKKDREHQSVKNRLERSYINYSDFYIKKDLDIKNYKSITVLDDVITTGSTLESICICFRKRFGKEIQVNALCIFRGKPYYLSC